MTRITDPEAAALALARGKGRVRQIWIVPNARSRTATVSDN